MVPLGKCLASLATARLASMRRKSSALSATSNASGTASASRRACADCYFMTFAMLLGRVVVETIECYTLRPDQSVSDAADPVSGRWGKRPGIRARVRRYPPLTSPHALGAKNNPEATIHPV